MGRPPSNSTSNIQPPIPNENDPNHRKFLQRSLDRCDREVAALQQLHRSLHHLKHLIEAKFGKETMLDIGEGVYFISNDVINDDDSMGVDIVESKEDVLCSKSDNLSSRQTQLVTDSEFQALVRDFLLRMKLRRKLMNRLSRRLMRLSHAMDGNVQKILPPPPPKYGDGRFFITGKRTPEIENGLKEFERLFDEKESIKRKIKMRKLNFPEKAEGDEVMEDSYHVENDQDAEINGETNNTKNDEKAENKAVNDLLKAENSENVKVADVENLSSKPEVIDGIDPLLLDERHQEDLRKLREYDEDYDKIYSVSADDGTNIKRVKYALTEEDFKKLDKTEEDFEAHHCTGIGAILRTMSTKEKVMEYKRWQMDILGKIPVQPTFEELGMMNRVFCIDKRRKSAKHEKDDKGSTNQSSEENNSDVDENKDTEAVTGEMNGDTSKHDNDDNQEKGSNLDKAGKDGSEPLRKRRPFSVQPSPSFYEQDYQRTLLIHSDVLNCAIHEFNKSSIIEATDAYNAAFRRSTDLRNQKVRLEELRTKSSLQRKAIWSNYVIKSQMAKARWQEEKDKFESEKKTKILMEMQRYGQSIHPSVKMAMNMNDRSVIRRSLSAAVDRAVIRNQSFDDAIGTPGLPNALINHNIRRGYSDNVCDEVGATLAACIDTVVNRLENGWITDACMDAALGGEQFPPFIPPDQGDIDGKTLTGTGETFAQLDKRLSDEIQSICKHLAQSENNRMNTWKKLMKAKQQESHPEKNKSFKNYDFTNTPMPQIKGLSTTPVSHSYIPPQTYNIPQTSTTKVRPPKVAPPPPTTTITSATLPRKHDFKVDFKDQDTTTMLNNLAQLPGSHPSKYSAEAVKARIHADGTVQPVHAPKKTKDGLFMRPAGRQRKGMDWDAVHGIWVPAQNS